MKVKKQTATDTASLLYQTPTAFADMGLNGSNDLGVKVSSYIGQWREATGNVAVGPSGHRPGFMSMAPSSPAFYAVAELPSAGSHGAGAMVFVTDIPSGAQVAYSDGTNWRSIHSGTVIA